MNNNELHQRKCLTIGQVRTILSKVSFAPSGIKMSADGPVQFQAKETPDGFLIRCSFWRPDTNTNEVEQGFGRWNHTPLESTEKSIVMTAWVAWKLVVEHEALEAFLYKNKRLFNPHKTLEDLAFPEKFED